MQYRFIKNVILRGKITVLTGVHIGGSKEKLEIGGVDSPVIRDPHTNYPYIPGSSLKGKMRMLLEYSLGKISADGKPHTSTDPQDEVCRIFGSAEKEIKRGPTRLIIRDAFPNQKTVDMWKNLDTELLYTEIKGENFIDRLTSEANPRFPERVVKGSEFLFEMVYGVYDMEGDGGKTDLDNFKHLLQSLRLLESSGIGGSVSRGYGQVSVLLAAPIIVTESDYRDGSDVYARSSAPLPEEEYCLPLTAELPVN